MDENQLSMFDGVITLGSPAGGVGRTSLTLALGAALAKWGSEVLLVDLDPRGSLSLHLGLEKEDRWGGVLGALADPENALKAVTETGYTGLGILACDVFETRHDVQLETYLADWRALHKVFEPLKRRYHTIIIDAPAGTGRVARAALGVADEILVPIGVESLGIRGLPRFLEAIVDAQGLRDGGPNLLGLLLNKIEPNQPLFVQNHRHLMAKYGDLLLNTAIPFDPWFIEAAARAMPMPSLLPEAPSALALACLLEELAGRRQ